MRPAPRFLRRRLLPPQFAHAARVAGAATLIIAIVYTGCVIALNLVTAARLTGQTDARLRDRATEASRYGAPDVPLKDGDDDGDVDDAPLFLWLISPSGRVTRLSLDSPALPAGLRPGPGWPVTKVIGGSFFRLVARRTGSQWIVAGQSLAQNRHTQAVLLDSEIAAAPLLLVAMFLGSLTVGLKALGPVEQSRRRQLEFTADASHELRTPLSVISAEADIALASPRSAAEYRGSLSRIQGEGKRLRRIVEDLLWLARFDSQPPPPGDEPLDVATIADTCADRFRPVARVRSITITADTSTPAPALISAPPEWIDRLAGVLMDNACRYAGLDGSVRISVGGGGRAGQPGHRGQRPGHTGNGTAAALRPLPPGGRRRPGVRAGAGHRGLDRALHRGPLERRPLSAARGRPDGRVVAPPPAAAPPCALGTQLVPGGRPGRP
jgi:signal transduction histidine kinase